MAEFKHPLTARISNFLREIGLTVVPTQLPDESFLPGVRIEGGKILVDEAGLLYPGDLLHEAGHLAVIPPHLRASLSDDVALPELDMTAVEAMAMAWSYAAALHLDLDPAIVFHEGGYRGQSPGLLFTFSAGVYPGAFGLSEMGMTATPNSAAQLGVAPYPHMLKWLRDEA